MSSIATVQGAGGYSSGDQGGTFTATTYTRRSMRCLGIMDHELSSLQKWGKELGMMGTVAIVCLGICFDALLEFWWNDNARAITPFIMFGIGSVVFALFARAKKNDIDDLAAQIRRDSQDVEPGP